MHGQLINGFPPMPMPAQNLTLAQPMNVDCQIAMIAVATGIDDPAEAVAKALDLMAEAVVQLPTQQARIDEKKRLRDSETP